MHLLVCIDIPTWLQKRIDRFIEICRGDLELEELVDCAFKRKMEPDADILVAEEWVCERIAFVSRGHDSAFMTEMYRIVDYLIRAIRIDPTHRAALRGYDELGYQVLSIYDDTVVIGVSEPDGGET